MLRLNLLPAERKKTWALAQQLQEWRGAMTIVVIGCLVANATLFVLERYQADLKDTSTTDLADWRQLTEKRETGQVTTATRQLNSSVSGLQSLFTPLSTSITSVAAFFVTLPPDIQLTTMTFAPDGTWSMSGIAATRASFLALRAALDDNENIANVATTSTASLREKVPFDYTGALVLQQ